MAGLTHGPLSRWRETVVEALISFYLVAQALVSAASVLRPSPRFESVYILWGVSLVAIFWLRRARGLSLGRRVVGVVASSSVAVIAGIVWTGLIPPTIAVLIAASGVLMVLGVGYRAALGYLFVMGASVLVIGGLIVSGLVAPALDIQTIFGPYEMKNWVRQAMNLVLACSMLAMVAHLAVSRIEREMSVRNVEGVEHARCSAALLELARARIIESGDLTAAFAAVTEIGARGLEVRRASVWMLEQDGKRLRCRALYDAEAPGETGERAIDVQQYPAYFAALAAGRSLPAENARTDPATHELAPGYLDVLGITSMLDAPIRLHDAIAGVVCLEHVGPTRTWSTEAEGFAGSLADFAARAIAAAERAEAYELLERLHRRVENAKEEERRHLARELHDELGQVLTALKLRLQLSARVPVTGEAGPRNSDSIELVDGLIARVRKISVDLSPALLAEAGIAPAIGAYLEGHVALAGITFDFDRKDLDARFAPELEIGAFRVVQEALTNVIRHSGAQHVHVSASRTADRLCLTVRDDGRGFDVQEAGREALRGRHFGLAGMKERVKGLGGTLEVRSSPRATVPGTEIRVSLPLSPPESEQ